MTASGRSMSVTSRLLPGNSNLATDQAAASPNTMFTGTAMAAVSSVSRIADRTAGSEKLAK